jgi:hypothetical protein
MFALSKSPNRTSLPTRVAFVCGDSGQFCELSRTLRRTVGSVATADRLQEVGAQDAHPLVAVHYDTLTPSERQEMVRLSRRAASPVLLLFENCKAEDFVDLFGARFLTNMLVVNSQGVDVSDLLVTVQKIRSGDIFGLEKYFVWGVEPRSLRVTSSDERGAVLDEIAEYATERGVGSRLRVAIRTVADEFLSNAIYNAPVGPDGAYRYAVWPRTAAVRLEAHEAAVVRYCCDGRRFGISIADPFGSLSPGHLQDHLARVFRRGEDQVNQSGGGAGVGLYQVFESLSHFVINIEPGVRTEMIGLIDVSGSYRTFASSGKSFNIFVRGDSTTPPPAPEAASPTTSPEREA